MMVTVSHDETTHQDADFEPIETVEMVGGALCFDFVNTGSRRRYGPFRERLVEYEDLIVWSRRTGLLDDEQAETLAAEATLRPRDAERVLEHARSLRESIYCVFSARAAGEQLPVEDVALLNDALSESGRLRRLAASGDDWIWIWDTGEEPLAWPLHAVAYSAGELLAEGERERIKECGGDNCNWLFYDASRNRSRRWCEMKDCGNRAKQRRHRTKVSAS